MRNKYFIVLFIIFCIFFKINFNIVEADDGLSGEDAEIFDALLACNLKSSEASTKSKNIVTKDNEESQPSSLFTKNRLNTKSILDNMVTRQKKAKRKRPAKTFHQDNVWSNKFIEFSSVLFTSNGQPTGEAECPNNNQFYFFEGAKMKSTLNLVDEYELDYGRSILFTSTKSRHYLPVAIKAWPGINAEKKGYTSTFEHSESILLRSLHELEFSSIYPKPNYVHFYSLYFPCVYCSIRLTERSFRQENDLVLANNFFEFKDVFIPKNTTKNDKGVRSGNYIPLYQQNTAISNFIRSAHFDANPINFAFSIQRDTDYLHYLNLKRFELSEAYNVNVYGLSDLGENIGDNKSFQERLLELLIGELEGTKYFKETPLYKDKEKALDWGKYLINRIIEKFFEKRLVSFRKLISWDNILSNNAYRDIIWVNSLTQMQREDCERAMTLQKAGLETDDIQRYLRPIGLPLVLSDDTFKPTCTQNNVFEIGFCRMISDDEIVKDKDFLVPICPFAAVTEFIESDDCYSKKGDVDKILPFESNDKASDSAQSYHCDQ